MAPYELRTSPAATRAIERLPEGVAAAIVEFLTGALVENPRRVGKPLEHGFEGWLAARRGAYRVVYAIDDVERIVSVDRIDHRSDIYHRR